MAPVPKEVAPAMLNEDSAVLPPTMPLNTVDPVPERVSPNPPLTVDPNVRVPPAVVIFEAAVIRKGPPKVTAPVPLAVILPPLL